MPRPKLVLRTVRDEDKPVYSALRNLLAGVREKHGESVGDAVLETLMHVAIGTEATCIDKWLKSSISQERLQAMLLHPSVDDVEAYTRLMLNPCEHSSTPFVWVFAAVHARDRNLARRFHVCGGLHVLAAFASDNERDVLVRQQAAALFLRLVRGGAVDFAHVPDAFGEAEDDEYDENDVDAESWQRLRDGVDYGIPIHLVDAMEEEDAVAPLAVQILAFVIGWVDRFYGPLVVFPDLVERIDVLLQAERFAEPVGGLLRTVAAELREHLADTAPPRRPLRELRKGAYDFAPIDVDAEGASEALEAETRRLRERMKRRAKNRKKKEKRREAERSGGDGEHVADASEPVREGDAVAVAARQPLHPGSFGTASSNKRYEEDVSAYLLALGGARGDDEAALRRVVHDFCALRPTPKDCFTLNAAIQERMASPSVTPAFVTAMSPLVADTLERAVDVLLDAGAALPQLLVVRALLRYRALTRATVPMRSAAEAVLAACHAAMAEGVLSAHAFAVAGECARLLGRPREVVVRYARMAFELDRGQQNALDLLLADDDDDAEEDVFW